MLGIGAYSLHQACNRLCSPVEILRQRVWLLAVIKTKSSLTSNESLPPWRRAGHVPFAFRRFSGNDATMRGPEEIAVVRRFTSAIVMLAALAPPAARAQVNIDQGKAPGQIYESDCGACHKSMRGLANGRSASALTSFLTEHYTSSAKEAAALAAYVLGGGGGVGSPAPVRPPKPTTNASTEEPKDREPKDREPKDRDAKRPGKPDVAAKPNVDQGTGAKSQRSSAAGSKPDGEQQQTVVTEPGKPVPGRREPNTGTAARTRGQAPPPPPPKPTTVVVVPSPPVIPNPAPTAAATEPVQSQPGGDAPVPRDNIPD
jgi:mono/diheme cytochrome c family protein